MFNKTKQTKLGALFCIIVLSISLIIQPSSVEAANWLFNDKPKGEKALTEEDMDIIENIYNIIQTNYIEDVDKKVLLQGALKGMVNAVGDPYSEFLTEKESEAYDETIDGSFHGIGVQFMLEGESVKVITAIDGTPAKEAGIQPNDIILKADGKELTGLNTTEIVDLIRGPLDSKVKLTIQRADKTFDVEIKRAEIPIETVTGKIDKNDKTVGYIKISQFNSTTYDELVKIVKQLRKEGSERFIIDLRYNPGGLLDQALKISNMFLQDGDTIMKIEEGKGSVTEYKASAKEYGKFKIEEPYVLLINDGSASASEILTGTIKENTKAPIVGVKSFGKGTVQNFPDSNYLGELKLTIAKWLLPSGLWIHKSGIEPTVVAEPSKIESVIALDPEEILEVGVSSPRVESLGIILQTFGYLDESQKIYDSKMEEAVKAYQKDNKLKVTGSVTKETTYALMKQVREYFETHDSQYEKALEIVTQLSEDKAA